MWDLDFYSSTRDALTLFADSEIHFLPRVFMYFDDVIGDDVWLCNVHTGERLAIEEFNQRHAKRKIVQHYSLQLRPMHEPWWSNNIYIYHDFAHPKYNQFIAKDELVRHQEAIKLSA
jgi:hypothetical protein